MMNNQSLQLADTLLVGDCGFDFPAWGGLEAAYIAFSDSVKTKMIVRTSLDCSKTDRLSC